MHPFETNAPEHHIHSHPTTSAVTPDGEEGEEQEQESGKKRETWAASRLAFWLCGCFVVQTCLIRNLVPLSCGFHRDSIDDPITDCVNTAMKPLTAQVRLSQRLWLCSTSGDTLQSHKFR